MFARTSLSTARYARRQGSSCARALSGASRQGGAGAAGAAGAATPSGAGLVGLGLGVGAAAAATASAAADCEAVDIAQEARAAAAGAVRTSTSVVLALRERVSVARYIDHTLLKADATVADVHKLCAEAVQHGFATVCVNGSNVVVAKRCLAEAQAQAGHRVGVCCVVGFPLGASTTETKAFEAERAIHDGASEIDMVMNIGRVKSKQWDYVLRDISAVVAVCRLHEGVQCKVIIETCLLTDEEKVAASELCALVGADFVKTSTGFSTGGATSQDVALMKSSVVAAASKLPVLAANGAAIQVKASGGVKNLADAHAVLAAGASRIGTSRGVALVTGTKPDTRSY